jgi:hypothetical protein
LSGIKGLQITLDLLPKDFQLYCLVAIFVERVDVCNEDEGIGNGVYCRVDDLEQIVSMYISNDEVASTYVQGTFTTRSLLKKTLF